MQLISTVLAFIFAVGVIVFVHEAGHLAMAKVFGVRVLTFSLGFGKRIWGFRRGETDYRISMVPLGGYVNFGGQDPRDLTDDPSEYLNRPRWQRSLILFAGPAMNVVLSIVLMAVIFISGSEIGTRVEPVVGSVAQDSPAKKAGLQPNDRILFVDGDEVQDWQKVGMAMLTSPDRDVEVIYERQGRRYSTFVRPEKSPRDEWGYSGLAPIAPQELRVGPVTRGSAAHQAGLRMGDALQSVDGQPITSSTQFIAYLGERPGEEVRIEIVRNERPVTLSAATEVVGRIGVVFNQNAQIDRVEEHTPAYEAGFEVGDQVRSVDDQEIDAAGFTRYVSQRAGHPIQVGILRDGQPVTLSVVPQETGTLGVQVGYFRYRWLAPIPAFVESVSYNINLMRQTLAFLSKIFQRRISAKNALGGPISIASVTGEAARRGFKDLLFVMAFLSINLFIVNLLPIPILDGGQLVVLIIEGTLRRDLSPGLKERIVQVGVVLIFMLMAMAIGFDLVKLWPQGSSNSTSEAVEAPATNVEDAPAEIPEPGDAPE